MTDPNSAYVDELYFQFLRDPNSVSEDWKTYFEQNPQNAAKPQQSAPAVNGSANGTYTNGTAEKTPQPAVQNPAPTAPAPVQQAASTAAPAPAPKPKSNVFLGPNDALEPLNSLAEKIAANMENSLRVPTATSIRTIPVKALEENRLVINTFLTKHRKKKISFTHILAWAIVRALKKFPQMNDAYAVVDGKPTRVKRGSINMGLAVDTTRKDGTRSLVVPSVKDSQKMTFAEFVAGYDGLIAKSRSNKLTLDDMMGATVSLTNPGMIGTEASVPRLMEGQGLIIAAGSIDYPAEFGAVMPDALSSLAISKVVTVTSTYDHRIIQGAESGEFLQYMHKLLTGEEQFYDQIFASLQIPFEPMRWTADKGINPFLPQDQANVLEKETRIVQMINSYRVRGHLLADINPLGHQAYHFPELDPSSYGFTIWDLDREFDTGGLAGLPRMTLRNILEMLREVYCGTTGIEYMHMQTPEKKLWVQKKIEHTGLLKPYDKAKKEHIFKKIVQSETFENFLHRKFVGQKRFSLEGSESTIPFMDTVLNCSAESGLKNVVIGMAHRGRLNVLANSVGKSVAKIFGEFEGEIDPESSQGSGDVKYHLGARGKFTTDSGNSTNVILAPNPSHLEAVNPVVEGMARAFDDEIHDRTYTQSLPVLLHGDAAFAGQGVVPETLNMSKLAGYRTGGTIHLIINNQIGFTTVPADSRSTTYATDIAKFLQVPILHVNGDDPEAVCRAAEFAFEWRQTFHEDVVVDMYSYRKYGHNEADEPTFTQPLLYKKIKSHVPVQARYRQQLIDEKIFSAEEGEKIYQEENQKLNDAFSSRTKNSQPGAALPQRKANDMLAPVETAVPKDRLLKIAEAITTVPEGFHIHPKLTDLLQKRAQMVNSSIDWAMGEQLAFGSILADGRPIRFTGQDVRRGTFSHRHAVFTDIENERELIPLNRIQEGQAMLKIHDSPLSEEAVLGYEYGYSVVDKTGITIWEAQFGDFVNGAQIQIDQFVTSGELKWGQTSNLVMLLPHGFEGQGPEHSSARLDRFLSVCAEDNITVCNLTTAAQYFHALRRHALRDFKKPMIIVTPKSLLRDMKAGSTIDDLSNGGFQEIIDDDSIQQPEDVQRVLLCAGKVYYDLVSKRTELAANDVAIIRVEQIYPFDTKKMRDLLEKYGRAKEVVWVQEEPKNMGAWMFVASRIWPLLQVNQRIAYVGRNESASPATGSSKKHAVEQETIKRNAFGTLG